MAEISEFKYAYFISGAEIIRIKIPMTSNSFKPEAELVFSNPSQPLPLEMGLFSHNHIVYMVGGYHGRRAVGVDSPKVVEADGLQYFDRVYMFDPTKFDEIPLENIKSLQNLNLNCERMVYPSVIRAEDRIYLLSLRDFFCDHLDMIGPAFDFQYFDPNKNLVKTLPPPPVLRDYKMDLVRLGADCHFFLRGYIYVFITDAETCFQTFKFNTINSEWEDCKSMVDKFKEKNIPFPFLHVGDMGISNELADNTWILVALNGDALPIAYNVHLSDKGDIDPISHRVLAELYTSDVDMYGLENDWKQLADMGGGRFCVMCCALDEVFLIYGFKIDFELEHTIQRDKTKESSSSIIFKMEFNHNYPIPLKRSLTGFCIASAPPPLASPDNEDQDKNDRKSKRKRGSRLFVYLFPALLLLLLRRR
ncbi:uncharacterized protein LOC115996398 [Ipomoea triloba]|uniref:uncharacterized protein LOC115996398 n=1 Tax=Ipomoea triloba TaxID=35885 RepID=UPI00125E1BDC|nr:uncharacterized protein LOC115996398 [Ipomoea triloba]XP_031091462.1 uncharacterized protein LOC115996398 [Ipomoea triloba]XP_031091463.1 uncharacterized protein LOC115996398 [Ipomoea triloba]XP_031091464.1 uncharacterized protein LOC115996398 [Ipomoea triloba]